MKRFLSMLLALCMVMTILPVAALAAGTEVASGDSGESDVSLPAEGTWGSITWDIDEQGYLTLDGSGNMEDQTEASGYPWYAYKDQITRLFIYNITSIGDHAFENYTKLEYFGMNDVTRIGEYAFAGTTAMTDCNMSDTLTSIEAYAFKDSSIFYIQFHSNPPAIADTAFTGVTADCLYPYGNTQWTSEYTRNYGGTLSWCEAVGTVASGDWEDGYWEVMTNGGLCIYNWSADEVAMTDLTSADAYPWYEYRDQVTYIFVGENWTHVGDYAFSGYPNVTEIIVGPSVTSIGAYAFANNSNATFIQFIGDAPAIDATAFTGVTAEAMYNSDMSGWTEEVLTNYGGTLGWFDGNSSSGGSQFVPDSAVELALDQEVTVTISEAYEGMWLSFTPTVSGYYNLSATAGEYIYAVLYDSNGSYIKSSTFNDSEGSFSLSAWLTAGQTYYYVAHYGSATTGSFTVLLTETELVTSGTCGENLTWSFNMETGTLTISGTGPMDEYEFDSEPWRDFTSSDIKHLVVEDGVTTISRYVFSGAYELESAVFPESLISIGALAFQASALAEFTLPSKLTTIGASAFESCRMTSVTIPASVTSIGAGAFSYCYKLTEFVVEEGNTIVAAEDGVLFNSDKTTLLQYPAAKALDSYTIPSMVTTIASGAFTESDLSGVTIHSGVTTIGDYAFSDCTNMLAYTVDAANPNYSTGSKGELMNKDQTTLILYPIGRTDTSYTVPDGVTYVEGSAFRFSQLKRVTLSDTVETLGSNAFDYCYSLESVDLNNVKVLSHTVFQDCWSLTTITIPASVVSIDYACFNYCENLKTIIFEGDAPDMYEYDGLFGAFPGVVATAYYPAGNATWTEEVLTANYGGDITWVPYTPGEEVAGDLDGDGVVSDADVAELLWYVLFPTTDMDQNAADVDGDEDVDLDDVIYLLWYTLFPDDYPL